MNVRNLICAHIASWLYLLALMPNPAWAQQEPAHSFEELQSQLKVRVDDVVHVTDQNGETFKGRIVALSTTSLRLDVNGTQRDLSETTVREVKKRHPDRWGDGVLIGAGIGAGTGAAIAWSKCGGGDCGEGGLVKPGFAVFGTAIGAGVGALTDFSLRRFDTLFAARSTTSPIGFRLSPVLSKGRKGIELSVSSWGRSTRFAKPVSVTGQQGAQRRVRGRFSYRLPAGPRRCVP